MSNPNEGHGHANDDHGKATVTVTVDDVSYELRPGKWTVSDLKAATNVDPAKVLAEITPQGLNDLDDGAQIAVHEKQRFMSHARSGGSS